MRIIYLNSGVMPSKHANSVQIAKMCEAMALNGHGVTLIAREGIEPAERIFEIYAVTRVFEAATVKLVGPRGTRTMIYLMRVLKRVRSLPRPDVFYARDPLMLAVVAHLGLPLIYESHYMPLAGTFRFWLLKWLFRRPNFCRLVCTTPATCDDFCQNFPQLDSDAVFTEPNAAAPLGDYPALRSWPGREGRLQVGFVGRPFPGKGIETVVEAAQALPDVDFHIVGAGPSDLAWLNTPIPGNMHFHGYREHRTLPAYYKRFDVAVAPYCSKVFNASGIESASITSPLKVLEYMAAGLPIVASDLPGVREVAEANVSGILVPPDDSVAFVNALARLRDDRRFRSLLAEGARSRFEACHTVRARAERVLAHL